MRILLACSAVLSEAARVNVHSDYANEIATDEVDEAATEETEEAATEEEVLEQLRTEMGSYQMLEAVSMASGWLNVTIGADHEANGKVCDTLWPASLNKQFKNSRFVGSGATACVYLAEDHRGQTVAVKVGKQASAAAKEHQLKEWTDECNDMKDLRVRACEGGREILKLHEHYMPSCMLVGSYSKGAYYVMHAAGSTPIRDAPTLPLSKDQKQKIFAELVQSVYSLHAIHMSHNDLHGQNIVLSDDHSLQLIDLGSLKTTARSWKRGYKRDSNAIWRWGAVLADCETGAQWPQNKPPKPQLQAAADAFENCIKANWNPDAEFMKRLHVLLVGDVNQEKDHHILELYETSFISQRTPTLKQKYVADETGESGCITWDKKTWEQHWFKKDYPNHVKCETIPAYHWQKTKTRRGKTRVTDFYQCAIPGRTFDSACYRDGLEGSEIWACGGCSRPGEWNPRACFFKSNPLYEKVPAYGR